MLRALLCSISLLFVACLTPYQRIDILEQKIDDSNKKLDQIMIHLVMDDQWKDAIVKGNGLEFENAIKTR